MKKGDFFIGIYILAAMHRLPFAFLALHPE